MTNRGPGGRDFAMRTVGLRLRALFLAHHGSLHERTCFAHHPDLFDHTVATGCFRMRVR